MIILLSCFSSLTFAQVNNNYNKRGIQKLHKINYKTPTTITIIKSISTALQFSAVNVWVVHVYICKCTCISHRIMHGIIIIYEVMSYSAKFLRAINFTDFAVFLQNVKLISAKLNRLLVMWLNYVQYSGSISEFKP